MTNRMRRKSSPKTFWAFAAAALFAAPAELASESMTLSTTYPSPAGVYNSLITTGGSAANNNTTLNRNGGSTFLVPNGTNAGGLVVVGNNAPLAAPNPGAPVKLALGGRIDLNGYMISNIQQTPLNPGDVASKAYVDLKAAGGPASWTCTLRSASQIGPNAITATVNCAAGEQIISGGCSSSPSSSGALNWFKNAPTTGNPGWQCGNYDNVARTLTAIANCCK